MDYFYIPAGRIAGEQGVIDGEEFSHLTHVMRHREGDRIRLVDGEGTAYDAVIDEIARGEARCRIESRTDRLHESAVHLTLGAALLKNGANFDFLVEKGTELGVSAFVPLLTERTIPRHARRERWQKIALAAMKQSGRSVLPPVAEPQGLEEFVRSAPGVRLIPHEKTASPFLRTAVPEGARTVVAVIGPEGGFTEREVALAVSAGFVPVSLGPRRLRAETAALATAGLVLLET